MSTQTHANQPRPFKPSHTIISGPCLSLRVSPESGMYTGLTKRIDTGSSFTAPDESRQILGIMLSRYTHLLIIIIQYILIFHMIFRGYYVSVLQKLTGYRRTPCQERVSPRSVSRAVKRIFLTGDSTIPCRFL